MVEILISLTPSVRDIRGVFYLLSLGKVVRPVSASVTSCLENVTFLNNVDLFIILRFSVLVNPFWRFDLEVSRRPDYYKA